MGESETEPESEPEVAVDQSTESEPLKAPTIKCPTRVFHTIEFPGYLRKPCSSASDESVQAALATLGGVPAINKGFNADPGSLVLNFRPNNPFSHPITGDCVVACNLLMKITKKTRRNKVTGEVQVKHDFSFIGIVEKTCRFRTLVDYQYNPGPQDDVTRLRYAVERYDIDGINRFSFNQEENEHQESRSHQIPPPSFTRTEWSYNYEYKQSAALVKVLVEKDGKREMKIVKKDDYFQIIHFVLPEGLQGSVLTEPPPIDLSSFPKGIVEALRTLFSERPVMTRQAFLNGLSPMFRSLSVAVINKLVCQVAFLCLNGPWQHCWIRYGYDPRKDPQARFYQTIDVRSVRSDTGLAMRAQRRRLDPFMVSTRPSGLLKPSHSSANTGQLRSHVFDGVYFSGRAAYQLCDLLEPELKELVESTKHVKAEYGGLRDGWYDRGHFNRIRQLLKFKIMRLQGRVTDDSYPQTTDDMDVDDNDDGDYAGSGSTGAASTRRDGLDSADAVTRTHSSLGGGMQAEFNRNFPAHATDEEFSDGDSDDVYDILHDNEHDDDDDDDDDAGYRD
ncbi:RNA polymerase III transcription factor IIIC subunit-domain-containing protein [Polychytrium aggregatum]|uniref:RNA polymerase III transcription factor IIIC subunit-domain-containing protein n=1 Tax=Polychytrium aggregatum TaxID=110093 RepID=UPI0022FEBFE5|nr:RNA polymerase III transcription factor IIIC subunit-domain-containing protein [Polychytrium aggregatum]KAI9207693.1 RNA polymerase III transcription factor IIIC subunit-domain-containing protein [Polychytrium aggregatum]